jgi:hypothetical protein
MKSLRSLSLFSLVALVGISLSTSSHATIVTWEGTGHLTEVDRTGSITPEFASAVVGTAFVARFTFDTASVLTRTIVGATTGFAYDWRSAIISSQLIVGGITLARAPTTSLIRLRDNFADPLNFTLPDDMVVDGITLSQDVVSPLPDGFATYSLIFRGPEDLSLYNGPVLPEDPSPLLTALLLNAFQFSESGNCVDVGGNVTCDSTNLTGHVDRLVRVSVPEPSSSLLLVFGILGASFMRRARAS